ncbi:MAG TPA: ABC transporter permease [Anaerolineaceae bacterium]|nr:ABC transporter permease [Anaerolineaceae bacterium]
MENTAARGVAINRKRVGIFLLDHVMEVFLVILIVGLTFGAHGFMTWDNWMNILRSNSLRGVIALGMTMVIIGWQIDLSIGSTVALAGVIVARFCRDLTPLGVDLNVACVLGMALSFVVAILIGWMHGTLITKTGIPPFIITLASKFGLYGLAGIVSGGYPIANQFPDWFNQIGGGRIGGQSGVPIPAIIMIVAFLIVLFIMNYTTTGRAVYAVGGNPESARLSGIDVGKTIIIILVAVQILSVVSGFMTSGQVMAGSYTFGNGWELDVIAAVIIGGTSFNGGIGTVWGTLLGIIFMGVISNGMTLLNFDIYTQYIVRAVIMALAVMISSYRAKVKA